jgi:ArsR family transcriptional regulator, arsenate/arsenite/antimonite-responsive transcriptional repressor
LYEEENIMEDEQKTLENENTLSSEEMKLLVVMGRALADPTRIRILGLLAERSMYGQELARVLDVKPPTVSHHISPLIMAGLVRVRRENNYHYYELDSDGIQHLAESTQHIVRLLFASNPLPPKSDERARVVATFIKDGRLVSIPAQYKKRRYVMEELARSFEWGRLYDEKEVNAILKTFHDDVASLRREFIDQRIMMRENGRYWLVRPHE